MSKEHFDAGSGEGRDLGIIPPSRGPEPDVMPLERNRAKSTGVFKAKEQMETGGSIQSEETVVERETPTPSRTREVRPQKMQRGSSKATMPTKAVASNLSYLHTAYSTIINNARSVRSLSDSDHDALDYATAKLDSAGRSHRLAHDEGRLGTNTMDRDVTHGHLQDMAASLREVHKTLKNSGVARKLAQHNLHAEMPNEAHVDSMVQHAYSLPRQGRKGVTGVTKPYKEVKFGRGNIPGEAIDDEFLARAKEAGGTEHVGVKKLEAGRGTPRGKGKLGPTADAEVNPKRRGSGRRIDTRFSSDANKIGKTPRFGEGGGTKKITGPTQLPPKRSEGRGGRGGAV